MMSVTLLPGYPSISGVSGLRAMTEARSTITHGNTALAAPKGPESRKRPHEEQLTHGELGSTIPLITYTIFPTPVLKAEPKSGQGGCFRFR